MPINPSYVQSQVSWVLCYGIVEGRTDAEGVAG